MKPSTTGRALRSRILTRPPGWLASHCDLSSQVLASAFCGGFSLQYSKMAIVGGSDRRATSKVTPQRRTWFCFSCGGNKTYMTRNTCYDCGAHWREGSDRFPQAKASGPLNSQEDSQESDLAFPPVIANLSRATGAVRPAGPVNVVADVNSASANSQVGTKQVLHENGRDYDIALLKQARRTLAQLFGDHHPSVQELDE